MLHSSSFSTNWPSPLRKNADQHPFDEQPSWQKPLHHHHGKATKTTTKSVKGLMTEVFTLFEGDHYEVRQMVNGGSLYLIRRASPRSSSSHGQPNPQPGLIYVDPDDPHRQCSSSACNDFPWEDLCLRVYPWHQTHRARSASWWGNTASGEHHDDGEGFDSHTYSSQPHYDLATSHRQTSCSSSMLTLRGVHQGYGLLRKARVERISAAESRIQVRASAPTQGGPDSLQNRRPTTSWDQTGARKES